MCKINGKKLAEIRKENGMTQEQFAEVLGVSRTAIQNYEKERSEPTPENLKKICMLLKINQGEIEVREIGYDFLNDEGKLTAQIRKKNNGITTNEHTPQGRWRNRDKAIISIFLTTGIRCSALMKLDITDIDIKKKTLFVTDKGDKVSSYYVSDETMQIVEKWINDRSKMFIDSQALFVTKYRKRMTENSISDVTKKYAFTIKEKNISPHKLRATYGTMLYDKTKDLYFVQKCMKHSSPKTTEIYIRGEGKENAEASEIMSKLL